MEETLNEEDGGDLVPLLGLSLITTALLFVHELVLAVLDVNLNEAPRSRMAFA